MKGHLICLLLGSNIRAKEFLPQAVEHLREHLVVLRTSSVWESHAVGSDGPAFLNAAVLAMTHLDAGSLKELVIRPVEAQLGRVRTQDKSAPRTIDIDLILFDQQVEDPDLWTLAHIAVPVSEIVSDCESEQGEQLRDVALVARRKTPIWLREDVSGYPFSTVFQNHTARRQCIWET